MFYLLSADPHSSIGSMQYLRTGGQYIFLSRIDDTHCDRIHSSLTTVHCFDNGYVGKQPVAWKEYCVEYWLKELQESMVRCTGCSDITEIVLEKASNTVQSMNCCLLSAWICPKCCGLVKS